MIPSHKCNNSVQFGWDAALCGSLAIRVFRDLRPHSTNVKYLCERCFKEERERLQKAGMTEMSLEEDVVYGVMES